MKKVFRGKLGEIEKYLSFMMVIICMHSTNYCNSVFPNKSDHQLVNGPPPTKPHICKIWKSF
jgi:hypothetical protein